MIVELLLAGKWEWLRIPAMKLGKALCVVGFQSRDLQAQLRNTSMRFSREQE